MMRVVGALLVLTVVTLPAQEPKGYQGIKEDLPIVSAPQPVAFSHRRHATAGSECGDCHRTAATEDYAGIPPSDRCMICHQAIGKDSPEVRKLAAFRDSGEKIRWVRVYRVPDFVFFSHTNHLKAGEKCETCHGPVARREVLDKEVSTSMTTCMNCHRERSVSNDCHFCHTLGH